MVNISLTEGVHAEGNTQTRAPADKKNANEAMGEFSGNNSNRKNTFLPLNLFLVSQFLRLDSVCLSSLLKG